MSRDTFMKAIVRARPAGGAVFGSGTSIVCQELMDLVGVDFPEGHLDADKMARLAEAGHSELGFDVVMPLFSVCHEAAAVGCNVDWGSRNAMPESGPPIFTSVDDIRIPDDLLARSAARVPIDAISLLKKRLGDSAAVCGKVFGGWTQAYHYFGVEKFLIGTIDDPQATQRILDALTPVTVKFARAQIDAGADCILLADHATRDLCSPGAYEQFLKPLHTRLAEEISVPLVLHICGNTSDRIGMIAQTGLDCLHWDTKTGTSALARKLAGNKLSLMGGISNFMLLKGSPEDISAAAIEAIEGDIDIVGPECAIPLATPLKNLKAIMQVGRQPGHA